MGNLFSKKPRDKVFSRSDVIAQTTGTYGYDVYGEPDPPTKNKECLLKGIDFSVIDKTALEAPPELLLENFWDISDHLVVSKSFDIIDDIFRVRAIFRWMTSFDIDSITTQILPPDNSPLDYFTKIQSDFGDQAHLFYVLCVSANIPCVVINGITKHGLYEVGDDLNRDVLGSKWNAVLVNGEWRLMDPFWASTSIQEGCYRDQIKVDEDGQITVTNEFNESKGQSRPVNDHFFLCDPDQFIWTHFPDDPGWQLLSNPITVDRFRELPYIREYFHRLEMSLSDEFGDTDNCILRPDGHACRISFSIPHERSDNYSFTFALDEICTDIDKQRDSDELKQYVMMEKGGDFLRFMVRFPFTGRFLFDIYGLDNTNDVSYKLICSYLIICGIPTLNAGAFPEVPYYGWGTHPAAKKIGIIPTHPKTSIIKTDTGIVEVRIPTEKISSISHVLKSTSIDNATLSRHAIGRFSNGEYIVNIRLPKAGEYTLKIYADVPELRGKLPDTDIMTFLIEFTGTSENAPFPFILGSQIGEKNGAYGLSIEAMDDDCGIIVAWNGKLQLKFRAGSNITMFQELSSNNDKAGQLMSITEKQEDGCWVYDLDLPVTGIYSLNLFAWDEKIKQKKVSEVYSYLIQSTGPMKKEELEKLEKSKKKGTNKSILKQSAAGPRQSMSGVSKSKGKTNDSGIRNGKFTGNKGYTRNTSPSGRHTAQQDKARTDKPASKTNSDKHINKNAGTEINKDQQENARTNKSVSNTNLDKHINKNEGTEVNKDVKDKDKATPRGAVSQRKKTVKVAEGDTKKQNGKKNTLETKTIDTRDNIFKIPIEQPMKNIFTSLRRVDANDNHADKLMVVKLESDLEVRVKGSGQYQLDVLSKRDGSTVDVVGRYTIIRRPKRKTDPEGSMATLQLFGSKMLDASVFVDSDDEEKVEDKPKQPEKKKVARNYGSIVPDLRSIKSDDLFDDDVQKIFTEATNREMMAKLRKSLKVKDLDMILKMMELYHSTPKSSRTGFPKSVEKMIKKIEEQREIVAECKMEQPVILDENINISKRSDDKDQLDLRIMVAHKIIDRNTRKEKMSRLYLEINQITLTEIKQYSNPPYGVHESVMATLLLLGDEVEELKDFSACQGLLFRTGNLYVMRRIAKFDPLKVPEEKKNLARKILEPYSMWKILEVSKGAAAFYMWVKAMFQDMEERKRPVSRESRCTTAKNKPTKRVPPRATILPEYISRRDGTIIVKL